MFDTHTHVHHHYAPTIEKVVADLLTGISSQLNTIKMNQQELALALSGLREQLLKSNEEVKTKLAALEQAVTDAGNVTPEVQEALDALKSTVQSADDIVPDAPPAEGSGSGEAPQA